MAAKRSITVGADIEFVFLSSNGSLVDADTVMYDEYCGGKFGTDGHSEIAEIRPTHSTNPRDVVKSLESIMLKAASSDSRLKTLRWMGGSYVRGESIGGHIHFGAVYSRLAVKYLDAFLASLVFILEDGSKTRSRLSSGYGALGDVREQPWGFEYRTLPSFLGDKDLTEGILALAKVIVEHAVSSSRGRTEEERTEFDRLALTPSDSYNFSKGVKDAFIKSADARIAFIKKYMPEYEKYRKIKYLFKCVMKAKEGRYKLSGKEIKKAWGIVKVKKVVVVKVTIDELWKEVENGIQ